MANAEISIKLDPQSVKEIADAVAARLRGGSTTHSNPPSSETHTTRSEPVSSASSDPWGEEPDPWAAQTHGAPSNTSAPAQASGQAGSAPTESPSSDDFYSQKYCNHGEMKLIPAGVYKSGRSIGKPRPAFWACPTAQGATDKCDSLFPPK